ncbi:hypothetical protein GQ457_11G032180 [Hibiscus cannabinus]
MQATWLPKGICLKLEKIIRGFVWGSTMKHRALNLVKWSELHDLVDCGVLGFRVFEAYNLTFIAKLGFQLIAEESKRWIQILRAKYKWEGVMPMSLEGCNSSRLWVGICKVWEYVRQGVIWRNHAGFSVDFWHDRWVEGIELLTDHSLLIGPSDATFVGTSYVKSRHNRITKILCPTRDPCTRTENMRKS